MLKPVHYFYIATTLIFIAVLQACSAPGNTKAEQRSHINAMHNEVLKDVYKLKPDSRDEIRKAPGYAVFSNLNLNIVLASIGNGFGVVTDNSSGAKTYMKMGEVGIGPGAGVKDFRVVFIFEDREVMQRFINSGWTIGAQADAAAKAKEKGAAVGGEVILDGIKIYQLTESGLALQATIKGTKYWKDSNLN